MVSFSITLRFFTALYYYSWRFYLAKPRHFSTLQGKRDSRKKPYFVSLNGSTSILNLSTIQVRLVSACKQWEVTDWTLALCIKSYLPSR